MNANVATYRADTAHFQKYERLIHQTAMRSQARATASGLQADHEELFGIFCEVYVKCKVGFDVSRGFEFSTYLVNACFFELGKLIRAVQKETSVVSSRSVEDMASRSSGEGGEYSVSDMSVMEDASQAGADDAVSAKQMIGCNMRRLRPMCRKVVEMLIAPDEGLVAAFVEHMGGMPTKSSIRDADEISVDFIADWLDIPRHERREMRYEFQEVYGIEFKCLR